MVGKKERGRKEYSEWLAAAPLDARYGRSADPAAAETAGRRNELGIRIRGNLQQEFVVKTDCRLSGSGTSPCVSWPTRNVLVIPRISDVFLNYDRHASPKWLIVYCELVTFALFLFSVA